MEQSHSEARDGPSCWVAELILHGKAAGTRAVLLDRLGLAFVLSDNHVISHFKPKAVVNAGRASKKALLDLILVQLVQSTSICTRRGYLSLNLSDVHQNRFTWVPFLSLEAVQSGHIVLEHMHIKSLMRQEGTLPATTVEEIRGANSP